MKPRFDAQAFDDPASKKILGLAADATISDWYSLLGVDKFESDEAKIAQAMQQRFELVRRYQVGNYEKQAQRLLDELGRARACLTNERERREYNKTLGGQTGDAFIEAIETVHFNDVVGAISVPAECPIGVATSANVEELSAASGPMEPASRSSSGTRPAWTGSDEATPPATTDHPSERTDDRTGQRRVAPVQPLLTRGLGRVALAIWTRVQLLDALLATLAGRENPLRHQLFRVLVVVAPLALIGGLSFHIDAMQKRSKAELELAQDAWSAAWKAADRDLLANYASTSSAAIEEKAGLAETLAQENEFREATVLYREALTQLSTVQADATLAMKQELTDAQEAWSSAWNGADHDRLGRFASAPLAAIKAKTALAERRSQENDFREAAVLYHQALGLFKTVEADALLAVKQEQKLNDAQQAWANRLGTAVEVTNSIGMRLTLIPPGGFMMGSPESERDRNSGEQQHWVTLSQAFYLGTTEVTQGQWQSVMGTTPWKGRREVKEGPTCAATYLSWNDAMAFCQRLSAKEVKTYSLPTESQWEYACRGGSTSAYSFGDDNFRLSDNGWVSTNYRSERYAPEVGLKPKNSLGLYDMHGNVLELCLDWYRDYPTRSVTDPQSPSSGSSRVARGGAWRHAYFEYRSARRFTASQSDGHYALGFRVAELSATQADATLAMKLKDVQEAWFTAWEAADRELLGKYAAAGLASIEAKASLAEMRVRDQDLAEAAAAYGQALDLLAEARDKIPPFLTPAVAPFDARQAVQYQQAWAKHLGLAAEMTNSIGMKLALIPLGDFLMGASESERDRQPGDRQHRVTLSKDFYLGTTEVTQGQWEAVMRSGPWRGKRHVKPGTNCPATYVSWHNAVEFCQVLSAKEGKSYSLPTESQWEYACRGGTTTAYSFDDNAFGLSDNGWWGGFVGDGNAKLQRYAHEVGTKRANSFGLYDMHGNVFEWCLDWYEDYRGGSVTDPQGPSSGSHRVLRGGSWDCDARRCRSAYRSQNSPADRNGNLGFRVALVR